MHTIWYTRCPVATASGIAYQRNMFAEGCAGSAYAVGNIKELGRDKDPLLPRPARLDP